MGGGGERASSRSWLSMRPREGKSCPSSREALLHIQCTKGGGESASLGSRWNLGSGLDWGLRLDVGVGVNTGLGMFGAGMFGVGMFGVAVRCDGCDATSEGFGRGRVVRAVEGAQQVEVARRAAPRSRREVGEVVGVAHETFEQEQHDQ